ncbi:L-threonylcarbamoyladenylate synthase [Chitinophaga ginsengisegetis]|uniref:L-threonylcarbamoyladenylate synthase n=1 Tax=Chitinophaga ginsengisegetis TaxID=393003 RepID=UPI000DBAA19E|nr:L-threonylcarbamoyladenylate synthase [Chitinophaga ginsengisegetis]MDR6570405.1 L-threonylcarbamoyladenylate synthase [Chitinophaga ginsengisegetis]MDR6650139.1 L-threonylcarbamoyladenylate synthase [Chitinophaga ginsengisegetis]MDR6656742.1 L-threonylcarbamoyladenylate synthase [Chitinophaga ginsengisegetis]
MFEDDISAAMPVLRTGGLILYPTDTIWGIGCDATDETAVQKIYALKKRSESKSLVILLADAKDLLHYVANPRPDMADIIAGFTRPTTVIYEGALGLAPNVIGEDGSIAIRIVKDPFCRHLIKRLRKPLVSTSANISGEPSPASFREVSANIRNGVDYVVKYRQNDETTSAASRIIRINKDGSIVIIRD